MPNPADNPDVLTQALAEPSRRAILERLRFGPKSVTELVHATGLKQPNLSNHLAKMRLQNIVHAERSGRKVYYSIARPAAELLIRLHEFAYNSLADTDAAAQPETPDADRTGSAGETVAHGSGAMLQDSGLPFELWRGCFLDSLLTGNEDKAHAVINEMLTLRVSLPAIYTEIFEWAMNRIGERFEDGSADVAEEHMATCLTERMMARVSHFYMPVARCARRALLGCVSGNWHALGARMLGDALRARGWNVLFLGANVPTNSFLMVTRTLPLDLVIVSCCLEEQMAEMRRLVDQLVSARNADDTLTYRVMAGGHCLNAAQDATGQIRADATARCLPSFLAQVDAMFGPATDDRGRKLDS